MAERRLAPAVAPRLVPRMPSGRKVRLAAVGEGQIVRAGLKALCRDCPEVLEWVERPVPADGVDVLLVDPWSPGSAPWPQTAAGVLREQFAAGQVLCFSWRDDWSAAHDARGLGFDGHVPKALPAQALALRIMGLVAAKAPSGPGQGDGKSLGVGVSAVATGAVGLSGREAQMLRMIAAGYTNVRIAEQLFLSPNSVKSFVRGAYRKIGVARRSQAVRWVLEHPESLQGRTGRD